MLEQGETTVLRQRSCTTKLHTAKYKYQSGYAACLGTHQLWSIQAVLVVIYMGVKSAFLEGRPQLTNVLKQCSYEIIWTLLGRVACAYTIAINSVSSGTVYLKHS